MNNTVIINSHVYTLVPYKTEEELNRLRNMCGFGPGYCACGCGEKVSSESTYRPGHNPKAKRDSHYKWKGGLHIDKDNYAKILMPEHPNANAHGHISAATLVVEKALGKYLPATAVVHHVDGDRLNNSNNNLVACENQGYHQFLEKRTRAYKSCGHADWLKCWMCQEYDDPENMYTFTRPGETLAGEHRKCRSEYYQIKKAEGRR